MLRCGKRWHGKWNFRFLQKQCCCPFFVLYVQATIKPAYFFFSYFTISKGTRLDLMGWKSSLVFCLQAKLLSWTLEVEDYFFSNNIILLGNELGDESAPSLAKAIKESKNLTFLGLSRILFIYFISSPFFTDNKFTSAGAKTILEACKQSTIQKIDFSCTHKTFPCLFHFHILDNPFATAEVADSLAALPKYCLSNFNSN